MAFSGLLTLILLLGGLIVYFVCIGFSKATVGEVGKWTFIVALLAFLMSAGMQSCSISAGPSGGSAQHR